MRFVGLLASVLLASGCAASQTCDRNVDCERGYHCAAGACTRECTPGSAADDCGPGASCSTLGVCVSASPTDSGIDAAMASDGGMDASAPTDSPGSMDTNPLAPDAFLESDAPVASDATSDVVSDVSVPMRDGGASGAGDTSLDAAGTPTGALVINEIDYDQTGVDTGEFVEIYNASASAVRLDDLALVLINGSGGGSAEYARASLSGSLSAGAYAVVGITGQVLTLPSGVMRFDVSTPGIQNGAPDGLVLWDTSRNRALDALSYEGTIPLMVSGVALPPADFTAVDIGDTEATGAGSLCRLPNGVRTGAPTDWTTCAAATPGLAN